MKIEKNSNKRIRFGTCTKDCYGSCVFKGSWNDDAAEYKFISGYPIKDHPFTMGFFCPKLKQRQDLIYHPNRLKVPLIRNFSKPKNSFEPINFDKALNIIAKKIMDINEDGNSSSILGAFYSGNSGLISMYSPIRFFKTLGATITGGGICNEGGCAGLTHLFGTYSTTNPFQLINPATRLIVVWGSNLSESNIHAYFLVKQAIRTGAKLVVIDSRRTQIAKKAGCFLHLYPGTDHLLAKLVINELINNKSHDEKFLKIHVDFYSSIIQEAIQIDKEKLISQTGIKSHSLQKFVDLLIAFKHHTIFNVGYGIQKDYYGGRIVKSVALIQIILGNFGKPGTGLIYSQSDFMKPLLRPLLEYITQITPDSNIKEITLINLGSILASEDYQLLFIYNFNPASSLPNQNQFRRALLRDDLFVVNIDMFLNETTKYADIVIPAKFDLESHDLISPYYIPGLSINIGGPCPYPNCMSNYEFFQRLAWRIGLKDIEIFQETEESIFNRCLTMLPSKIRKEVNSKGYYLYFNLDYVAFTDMSFPTQNNRIQALGPHFKFGREDVNFRLNHNNNEFLLITPSHPYFLHSQLGQLHSKYLEVFGKVYLTSEDIKSNGFIRGNPVLVSNEYGNAEYILEESRTLKSRMALIFSGPSSPFSRNPNANFFTPDKPEELGLSGAYNSGIVKILKILEER